MDLVTTNLVDSFREEQGFSSLLALPTLFEHFANYCVASSEYPEEFDVEDLHVAGGNDLQLDDVMVIVNGVLVDSVEEVDDLIKTNKFLDADFVFVQAKTGGDFSGAEISNMFYGIRDLFAQAATMPRNDLLAQKEIHDCACTMSPLGNGKTTISCSVASPTKSPLLKNSIYSSRHHPLNQLTQGGSKGSITAQRIP